MSRICSSKIVQINQTKPAWLRDFHYQSEKVDKLFLWLTADLSLGFSTASGEGSLVVTGRARSSRVVFLYIFRCMTHSDSSKSSK